MLVFSVTKLQDFFGAVSHQLTHRVYSVLGFLSSRQNRPPPSPSPFGSGGGGGHSGTLVGIVYYNPSTSLPDVGRKEIVSLSKPATLYKTKELYKYDKPLLLSDSLLSARELPESNSPYLRSSRIDSEPDWPVCMTTLFDIPMYRPARLHRLAESVPWNRFLGSLNVYEFGVWRVANLVTTLLSKLSHPSFRLCNPSL
jgi:hypothetical protein